MACHADWPLFYMNDFSRFGMTVACLPEALAVLRSSGVTVHEDDRGSLVVIEHRHQLARILDTLTAHRIEYEMTDLVSCVYQG